jgi:hypothetical protein
MLNFHHGSLYLEEEMIGKLKDFFIHKYQIENKVALNMAMDFIELFSVADGDMVLLNKFYLQ